MMNFRNAYLAILIGLLLSALVLAQQSAANSPSHLSADGAVAALDQPIEQSGTLKVFFTGYLLGYYRLPQWQTNDFETNCPAPEEDNKTWKNDLRLGHAGPSTLAEQFINLLNTGKIDDRTVAEPRKPDDVLVGMGDNFGVTLESRVYRQARESESSPWRLHPKSRDLKPLDPNNKWPEFPVSETSPYSIGDNVGCFLSMAAYDAIVPGKDDFYFGPERLRRIAARLAAVPEKNDQGLHPVSMLGANLVLKTDPLRKPPEILDSDKTNLRFLPGLPSGVKSLDASDNGVLLPFVRQLRFQFSSSTSNDYSPTSFQPFLCSVGPADGLDSLNPALCEQFANNKKPWLRKKEATNKTGGTEVWDFDLPNLSADLPAHYGLCVKGDPNVNLELKSAKKDYYCLRLTVAEPLFGGKDSPPYVVKRIEHPDKTISYAVIVGIVDPDLASLVGRDNLSWRNNQAELEPGKTPASNSVRQGQEVYGTSVNAMDPATAVALALRHFDQVGREANHIPRDAKIFKILLAQMERGKAETLAANLATTSFSDTALNFDLVFSSATDFPAATADEQVSFVPTPIMAPKKPGDTRNDPPRFRQLVVVPWRAYDRLNDRLPDPLRTVTLIDTCNGKSGSKRDFTVGGNWGVSLSLPPTLDKNILEKNYDDMGQTYLHGRGYWPPPTESYENKSRTAQLPSLSHTFELAALDVLRNYTGADVALLQKRDFYWGPFIAPLNQPSSARLSGELIESILWMGDYLQVLTVKGDTLKKVLDDSDKLDALDAQTTNLATETGRGLLIWGIQKTRDKQYLVDGVQLDPSRLYTVATSNHISAGDTGYPELADPQFADPRLPRTSKHPDEVAKSPRLSSLICKELVGESCVENPELQFATIQQLPSQLEPTITARMHAWGRSFIARPQLLEDGNSLADYQAQLQKPTWRLSLKDLSLNLSGVRNNLSEVQRSTELAAVTESSAANPKAHAIDYSAHFEFVHSDQRLDEFVRGLTIYKATVTASTQTLTLLPGQTTPPTVEALPLISRSKNQGAVDAGFFLHRKHKYDSRWGLVYEPLHFDTPLHRLELPINSFYSRTTDSLVNPAFTLKLDRDRRFLQRLGFRAESSLSSVELGVEGGWEQNALQEVTSNLGPCQELATQTLSSCLKTFQQTTGFVFTSLHQMNGTRENNGAYVNLDWTVPLIWKLSFHTEDYGEYYRPAHLDNSTNTLYRNDAKETLKFSVLPNLTLGPGLERFDYENKVEHIHFRTWSPVFNVTYSFDRYSGGDWGKSLGYSRSTK